jgi:hypothetical protein
MKREAEEKAKQKELEELAGKFSTEGPGTGGAVDMDPGSGTSEADGLLQDTISTRPSAGQVENDSNENEQHDEDDLADTDDEEYASRTQTWGQGRRLGE